MVKKLNLETIPHPKPYPLGWICEDANLQVSKKWILRFAITENFVDTIELDVVPLDITGIFLGNTYLYDRKSISHHHEKKYHLLKYGKENIVRAHRKKANIAMVNVG